MRGKVAFFASLPILLLGASEAPAIQIFDLSLEQDAHFETFKDRDFWNVDTDSTGLRVSKPADDGTTFEVDPVTSFAGAGITSRFFIDGDFSISVDYNWNLVGTPSASGGASVAQLQVTPVDSSKPEIWVQHFFNWDGNEPSAAFL